MAISVGWVLALLRNPTLMKQNALLGFTVLNPTKIVMPVLDGMSEICKYQTTRS
jgi:hypothetical protein